MIDTKKIADALRRLAKYEIPAHPFTSRQLNGILTDIANELDPQAKPLLADAQVGDLCQLRNGKWVQIDKIHDGSLYAIVCSDMLNGRRIDGKMISVNVDNKLDIIHTEPLAEEGTAEWAWQMLMLQKPVSHPAEGEFQDTYPIYTKEGFVRCMAKTGWQLYEPVTKAGVPFEVAKDVNERITECLTELGCIEPEPATEPKPRPQYKVGDWVEHKESKEQATIRRIMSYGAIEIEFAYSTESDIYQANDFHNDFRKLSPSEVIVKIGCLEGTVAPGCSDITIMIVPIGYDGMGEVAIIPVAMLDPATRELVESLLKAQEEKCHS